MFFSSSYFCQLCVLLNQYHCISLSDQTVAQRREIEVEGATSPWRKRNMSPVNIKIQFTGKWTVWDTWIRDCSCRFPNTRAGFKSNLALRWKGSVSQSFPVSPLYLLLRWFVSKENADSSWDQLNVLAGAVRVAPRLPITPLLIQCERKHSRLPNLTLHNGPCYANETFWVSLQRQIQYELSVSRQCAHCGLTWTFVDFRYCVIVFHVLLVL